MINKSKNILTAVTSTGDITGDISSLNINWNDFDQRYISKDKIISSNTSPYILTSDWSNNISKIDKQTLIVEITEQVLMSLRCKLDIVEKESDNTIDSWNLVKDAVMAYIVTKKLTK